MHVGFTTEQGKHDKPEEAPIASDSGVQIVNTPEPHLENEMLKKSQPVNV